MFQTAYCYRMLNDSAKEAEYMKKISPLVRKVRFFFDQFAQTKKTIFKLLLLIIYNN